MEDTPLKYYEQYQKLFDYTSSDEDKKSPGDKLKEDIEQTKEMMRKSGYTEEEISIVTDISLMEIAKATKLAVDIALAVPKGKSKPSIEKADFPTFYQVAGQPGCGKSAAIKAIESSAQGRPYISEMDVYRTKHPRINEIKEMIAKKYPTDREKQGKDFVAMTSLFADIMELSVTGYLISQGYSVIKETTGKNSKSLCGMIDALRAQTPEMKATMACMAVSQEVSIDGTVSRGRMMNKLTSLFVEELSLLGIESKPVGRGNVPRTFSESVCRQIPSSMKRVAESGLIDGEFLIVKRGKEDSIISRMSGDECKKNADFIMQTIEDRITGKLSQLETQSHFKSKAEERSKATEEIDRGNIDATVDLYVYPTKTWLKETDGALDFYKKQSGLTEIEDVAKWLIKEKYLKEIVGDEIKVDTKENLAHFDEENKKIIVELNGTIIALQQALAESMAKREEISNGVRM